MRANVCGFFLGLGLDPLALSGLKQFPRNHSCMVNVRQADFYTKRVASESRKSCRLGVRDVRTRKPRYSRFDSWLYWC